MQRVTFLLFIGIVTVSSAAVKLTPEAKKYVDAASNVVTRERVCKLIKIIASKSSESKELIQSLSTIKPAAYQCFANNGNKFSTQAKNGQIKESDITLKVMQACAKFTPQITQLQKVGQKLGSSYAQVANELYQDLPEAAKTTLTLIQQSGQVSEAEKPAKIREITASIRKYSDADLNQIATVIPGTADFILPNGTRHAEFMNQLDMMDKHADGTITDEEKQQMAEESMQMNENFREHFVENMERVSESIDNRTLTADIENDAQLNQVCNSLGTMLVNQYNRRTKTPAFIKQVNQAVKQSNQMHQAAAASTA